MPRLILSTGGEQRAFEITGGVTAAGREPDNAICLPHPSVSGHHCEFVLDANGLLVRDLASTNGTFVEGAPVSEARIEPGQTVRLGDVELIFEAAEPDDFLEPASRSALRITGFESRADGAAAPPLTTADSSDDLICESCRRATALSQARKLQAGRDVIYFCPACGGQCHAAAETSPAGVPVQPPSFSRSLLAAFGYPLSSDGLMLLAAGAVFFATLSTARFFAQFALVLGLVAILFITVLGTGYLFSFLKSVVAASAHGEEHVPRWPDFSDFGGDIIGPFFQCVAMMIVCFGPALLGLIYAPESLKVPLGAGFFLLGLLYLPMSMVAISLYDSVSGMHPMLIINSILRILPHYLLVLLFLGLALLLRFGALAAAARIPIPLLPILVTEFISFYFLIVIMRMLGVMYHVNRRKLGWF